MIPLNTSFISYYDAAFRSLKEIYENRDEDKNKWTTKSIQKYQKYEKVYVVFLYELFLVTL